MKNKKTRSGEWQSIWFVINRDAKRIEMEKIKVENPWKKCCGSWDERSYCRLPLWVALPKSKLVKLARWHETKYPDIQPMTLVQWWHHKQVNFLCRWPIIRKDCVLMTGKIWELTLWMILKLLYLEHVSGDTSGSSAQNRKVIPRLNVTCKLCIFFDADEHVRLV